MNFLFAAILFSFCVLYAAHPFVGETLDYEIGYGFISAGKARLLVRKTGNENELEIISRAWNHSFFKILTVDDTVKSTVTADSLVPKVFSQRLKEGSYVRNALTIYNFKTKKARIKDTAYKAEEIRHALDTTITLDGNERCILSAFYLARTFKFEPGDTVYFNAIGGKKKYPLKVICHRRDHKNGFWQKIAWL